MPHNPASGGIAMPKPKRGDTDDTFTILDPGSTVEGKTIAEWTAEWWTWAVGAPSKHNPFFDETGALAHQRNDGDVFFLVGTFGGSAERDIKVHAGEPILLPLVNFVESLPNDPQGIEAVLDSLATNTYGLFAEIDGVAVADPFSYFEESGFFSLGKLRANSLAGKFDFFPAFEPGEELTPAKAAGWWLMIEGLDRGEHTLHFGGSIDFGPPGPEGDFSTDTTVHLRIVGHDPDDSRASTSADYVFG